MIDEHLNELRLDVPPMPDAYMRRIDLTIKEIEDMHIHRRAKLPVAILALLLAALVLSGIALAASKSKIAARLFPYQGEPADLSLPVERDLAECQLDGIKLSIDEALHDGSTVRLQWSVDSEVEGPVYVGYELDICSGEDPLFAEGGSFEKLEYVLRMLNGTPRDGYLDIYLDEPYIGRPVDVTITAHVFSSPLSPVSEGEDLTQGNALFYTEEEAKRREAADIIVVDMDGYANLTRYPTYAKVAETLNWGDEETYAQFFLKTLEKSGLMKKIAVLDVKATLNANEKPLTGSLQLKAPQTITRGDEVLTVTRADFTPASTSIEFTALIPAAFYDPETNDWHGSFEYPLMLTNDARDPLMMDLGIGWEADEQEDGSYLLKGFMQGRPMANLEQDFYLVVSDPEKPIKKSIEDGNFVMNAVDAYRAAVTIDDPGRILKLNLTPGA